MSRSLLSRLASASYKTAKYARIGDAAVKGGIPAVSKQYVRRVIHRKEIGLLRRGRLW